MKFSSMGLAALVAALAWGRARAEDPAPVVSATEKIVYTPKPREAEAALSSKGVRRPEAWTKGAFRIHYLLVQGADVVKAQNIRIHVKNTIVLPKNASKALIHHETVHKQINEAQAARIQKELASFTRPCKDWRDLERAEKEFKQEFYADVRAVNDLHKAWDGTNKLR